MMIMNVREWPKECYHKFKQQRWDFMKSSWHDTYLLRAQLCNPLSFECFDPLLRIKRSQLHWFGNVTRISQERLAGQVLLAPMGMWPRGWPRIRWHDGISNLAWLRLSTKSARLSKVAENHEVFWEVQRLLPMWPSPCEKLVSDMRN